MMDGWAHFYRYHLENYYYPVNYEGWFTGLYVTRMDFICAVGD